MSTTYTWHIHDLERTTADGIVFNVSFSIEATDGTYSARQYGSVELAAPAEGAEVIPYTALTPSVVTGWVQDVIGAENIAALSAALSEAVAEQAAPTKAAGLPW